MNIDLMKYTLIKPLSIKHIKKETIMYDITVKDDHTFYIYLDDDIKILAHNCDGHHIASLLINFFHKWFPQIIENKQLFRITTPLVVCNMGKEKKYFYTLPEYEEFCKTNKVTNPNYLKGLGSLDEEDWKHVMDHKLLFSIIDDRSTDKFLEMAFGESTLKRKKWLQSE
jgi:DNA gyrase/topoisomerase IV subunit B